MKRILFLDDNPARLRWALTNLGPGNVLTLAETSAATIAALESANPTTPFNVVYLDHDLGDEEYADSGRTDTGYEVVRWIIANRPTIGTVVVHTANTPAGQHMTADLVQYGYDARYVHFLRLCGICP